MADPMIDVPRVINPEAIGDPEQTPVVEVPASQQGLMRRLINNNRRSLGLDPQCPCCEGDAGGTARDLCDTCRAPVIEGTYPHGCKRTA